MAQAPCRECVQIPCKCRPIRSFFLGIRKPIASKIIFLWLGPGLRHSLLDLRRYEKACSCIIFISITAVVSLLSLFLFALPWFYLLVFCVALEFKQPIVILCHFVFILLTVKKIVSKKTKRRKKTSKFYVACSRNVMSSY